MDKFLVVFIIFSLTSTNVLSITLDGVWNGMLIRDGSAESYTKEIPFAATIPGGVYTDLARANIIPKNLFSNNDVTNRWVGNQSVVFSTSINADNALLEAQRILLIFHGVDTFSTIFLNDEEIGKTTNMFVRYTFDVKEYLKPGKNTLKVALTSAVKTAEALFHEQAQNYVVPPLCVPREYNGECHVNHVRKMQASFSWDWGPAFPSIGIWKNVELIPIQDVEIMDISTTIQKEGENWMLSADISLETASNSLTNIEVLTALETSGASIITNTRRINLNMEEKRLPISTVLIIPNDRIDLWWPNGYGKQVLYTLRVIVKSPNSVAQKTVRVGFREVELVEEPLKEGRSFYFRINGVPIFAKGSNFIPASVFPELGADPDTIKHLLLSSKETHMNMLRVWGGGVYESDLFYDLADEYGIMIWQDFMFACGMYPTAEQFLTSVKEEVVQNVQRLKNHASIILWAGNNENEAALYGDWYGTSGKPIYRSDYVKLYIDLIKNEVEQLDNTRPFVASSPSNGIHNTAEYNYTGKNPYSNLYGDVHYYNYIKNPWDVNQYPRARFSSEYGFQSLPSIHTIMKAAESITDLSENSNFMKHRQHLPHGDVFMRSLISRNLKFPSNNDTLLNFIDYIYLSQINQAVAQRIQTEFYRQAKSDLNSVGEGMTMGALYWQLNDVWQAPSWSSIDINGRWKMLQYYAADFFAPVIITSHLSQANELSLFVVSDLLYSLPSCTIEVSVFRWEKTTPIHVKQLTNIELEANKAKLVDTFWLDKFLEQVGCGSLNDAKEHCIIMLTLKNADGSLIAPTNYVYPAALKSIDLPLANITMRIEELQIPGKYGNYPDFSIELTSDNISLFVWLETGAIRGQFSENGFHMFESTKRIILHTKEITTPAALRESIRIITLSDIYNTNRRTSLDDIIVG